MCLLSLVASGVPKVKRKRPPSKMVALYLWIMQQHTSIIAIRSPSMSEKLSRPSITLINLQVTMLSVSSATMPTMLLLAPVTSGLISNFRIKIYPFPALAKNGPIPYSSMIFFIGHKLLIRPMFSNSGILQWTIPSISGITYLAKKLVAPPSNSSHPLLVQTMTIYNGIMFGTAHVCFTA
jgi:hypothetical protein